MNWLPLASLDPSIWELEQTALNANLEISHGILKCNTNKWTFGPWRLTNWNTVEIGPFLDCEWWLGQLPSSLKAIISFLFESECHVIALGPHGCRHHIEVRPRLGPQVRPSVALFTLDQLAWKNNAKQWAVDFNLQCAWSSSLNSQLLSPIFTPFLMLFMALFHPFSRRKSYTSLQRLAAHRSAANAPACACSWLGMSGLHASQEQMQKIQIVDSICDDIIKIEWYS